MDSDLPPGLSRAEIAKYTEALKRRKRLIAQSTPTSPINLRHKTFDPILDRQVEHRYVGDQRIHTVQIKPPEVQKPPPARSPSPIRDKLNLSMPSLPT